ncbi:MAG: hypothetical protein WCA37_06325 [Terracidiphilus sp.]
MRGTMRDLMRALTQSEPGRWCRTCAIAGLLLSVPWLLSAQTSAPKTPTPSSAKKAPAAPSHTHHRATKKKAAKSAPVAPPEAPAPPPMPNWPVNEKPTPAKVTWDKQGLRVDATNSSLMQIAGDVSTATGAKFVGLNQDQRVFGTYGPGPVRDVISQLLQGSGYNIVMVGGQGLAAPSQILLTARGKAGQTAPAGAMARNAVEEEPAEPEPEEPPQPQEPPVALPVPGQPGMGQPGTGQPSGTPQPQQQILQQMQQRQMQQQHPEQQPQNQ